jgi:hypothetical protein
MTHAEEQVCVCIRQLGESVEHIAINGKGDPRGKGQAVEDHMPIDVMVIRHGNDGTKLNY